MYRHALKLRRLGVGQRPGTSLVRLRPIRGTFRLNRLGRVPNRSLGDDGGGLTDGRVAFLLAAAVSSANRAGRLGAVCQSLPPLPPAPRPRMMSVGGVPGEFDTTSAGESGGATASMTQSVGTGEHA